MCGIAGFARFDGAPVDARVLAAMSREMAVRGPDDEGYLGWEPGKTPVRSRDAGKVAGRPVVLAHRRLSIIDLGEGGWQPMSTRDDRHHLVYNGEIYNYRELARELESEGVVFTSSSDSEVLLAALARWGIGCLGRLVGMFAFAWLDTRERRLTLARDPFGIKPLYHAFTPDGFAFASDLRSLLAVPDMRREAVPQRVFDYLTRGSTDYGGETLLRGIRALPAAHHAVIDLALNRGRARETRYWSPRVGAPIDIGFDDAAREVRERFLDNVRLHLRSDVAVGACLSGGIDSSAIVACMRQVQGEALDLHTFSFIPDDPELSEERYIDLVNRHTGAHAHKVYPDAANMVEDLDHLIDVQGEPFGSTTIYAQYRVFKLASEHRVKVMLDGQGADELLAGYRFYLVSRLASMIGRDEWGEAYAFARRVRTLPNAPRLGRLLAQALFQAGYFQSLSGEPARARPMTQDSGPAWIDGRWCHRHGVTVNALWSGRTTHRLAERLADSVGVTSLPHLLRYEDRNSMAFSIESRVPFLTPGFADFVLSLPEAHVLDAGGESKSVFRRAMRGIVPDAILDRRDKLGFSTPEEKWLKAAAPSLDAILTGRTARDIPIFDHGALASDWEAVKAGRRGYGKRVWRWANLVRWTERNHVTYAS